MDLIVYELQGDTYAEIGRVQDGETTSDELHTIYPEDVWTDRDPAELAARLNGPRIVAVVEDDAAELKAELDITGDGDGDSVTKEWERYDGPQGGEGWRNTETDEVRYQDAKPGADGEGDGEAATPEVTADLPNANTFESVQIGDIVNVDATDWQGQLVITDLSHNSRNGDLRALYGHPPGEPDKDLAVNRAVFDGIAEREAVTPENEADREWIAENSIMPPESPDTVSDEWKHANLFPGQRVYIDNGRTEVVGEVVEVHTSGGTIHDAEVKLPDERHPIRFTNLVDGENFHDYEISAIEDWESLSDERKRTGLMQQFDEATSLKNIPKATQQMFRDQLRDEILPSVKSDDFARNLVASFFLLEDRAGRANVRRFNSGYRMQISENAPISTTRHEFGHGVASSYGYDYRELTEDDKENTWSVKWYRRPANVSHEWQDLRVEYGGIPFDFEASKWYAPETYQFRDVEAKTRDPETLEIGEMYGGSDSSSIMTSTITPTGISQREDGTYVIEVDEYRLPVFMNEAGEILDHQYGFTDWDDYMETQSFPPKPLTNETIRVEGEDGVWEATVDSVSSYNNKIRLEDAPHTSAKLERDGGLTFSDDSTGRIQAVEEKLNVSPDIDFRQPPVGYDEWRDDVDAELDDREHFGLEDLAYDEPIPDGEGVHEAFETLQPGDVVSFDMIEKVWEDGEQVEVETDRYLIFQEKDTGEYNETEHYSTYTFETERGGEWSWVVFKDERGLKTRTGSEPVGIARQPDINTAQDYSDEAENPDHPLARWRGFNTTPETVEDEVGNLLSACNRAWYKQAKTCEDNPEGADASRRKIGSFYSTTNAHETLAMTNEVMQTPDDHTLYEYESVVDEHPPLVAAYLELFEVPAKTKHFLKQAGWEN